MNIASPLLNILIKSIRNTRKLIVRDFNEIEKLQSSIKKNDIFLNNLKLKLQTEINQILSKIKPGINIGYKNGSENKECWILNFTDFYFNFARANENVGFGIAYKTDKSIKTYLFYNPVKDDFFFFEKGAGAFKNDFRLRVSSKLEKKEIIIGVYKKYEKNDDKEIIKLIKNQLSEHSFNQRESGSLAFDLCEFASGKIDCLLFANPLEEIDLISKLILTECGGKLNIFKLGEDKIYVCTNKLIEKTVKEMVENYIITS